jgi:chromosome segregation ATPase
LNTTIGDPNESILRAQLEYLQHELENANDQLDNNFSRLEAAGLSGVALAEKLAAAEDRIAELEEELQALAQRNKASLALVSAQRDENG